MADFEHFVTGLGPHAKHYTPEQLKQLFVEVQKLAAVLLAVCKARAVTQKGPYPQLPLDGTGSDRTLEGELIQRDDGS